MLNTYIADEFEPAVFCSECSLEIEDGHYFMVGDNLLQREFFNKISKN